MMAFSWLIVGCWHQLIQDDCGCNFGETRESLGGSLPGAFSALLFLKLVAVCFWNPVAFLHGSAYYAEINCSKSPSCLV